ncbi:RNA polymerase sigma factor [Agaribacter flavus]|uniref:RNA polymerase sigma factor n=1 Tax=Agaribacter flavus TaxID=1902781 RepID=A0ABV7FRA6_9ALTE
MYENDEESIILAAQKGDRIAFKTLYERHIPRVYALCFRLCADKSHAEDAAQEVFIQLWRKLDNYDRRSQFSTWLYSVTANVTISYLRRQKAWWQKAFSIETEADLPDSIACDPDITSLEKHIFKLPERARWVFVLHAIEGYRHEEIGKMLGMAVGTSKAQFHRAKQLVEESIEHG